MVWIIWLLLCCGPPAIVWFKGRSPIRFFPIVLGMSGGPYLLVGGFMSVTGATTWATQMSGMVFGVAGLIAAYAVAVLANESVEGRRSLRRKRKEKQCPNCGGFVSREDEKCRSCGAEL